MAFTLVANTSAQSSDNTNVTTGGITTTGATLLIAVVSGNLSPSAAAMSDSKGNTWTKGPATGSAPFCTIYYSTPSSTGTSHTFTFATVVSFPTLCVLAFVGAKTTSPLDQTNSNNNNASATIQAGSITPTTTRCLVIAGCAARDFAPPDQAIDPSAIDGGFTISNHGACDGTPTHFGGAAAYLIQTSAAAANPTWTPTGGDTVNNTLGAVIASFFAINTSQMFEVF